MTATDHHAHHGQTLSSAPPPAGAGSLNRIAWAATLHCLTGCAIGEVAGMVIGSAYGFSTESTIALAVGLAFLFGYAFTVVPLLRGGLKPRAAFGLALAANTASITVMEIVDNAVMLTVPGAMDAGLASGLFWAALVVSLAVAAVAAFPINRYLIAKGRGHALVHARHGH